jgi:pSer/pThr/pTyr-binding forkhead associated (FHA) protein
MCTLLRFGASRAKSCGGSMWRLLVFTDMDEAFEVPLVRVRYRLGRDPRNSICLLERNVSRRHAELEWDPDREQYLVLDVDSWKGTRLNGELLEYGSGYLLHDGDSLRIGNYTLIMQAWADRLTDRRYASRPIRPAHLLRIEEPHPECYFTMTSAIPLGRRPLTVGASPRADITIAHEALSPVHCELRLRRDGLLLVVDKKSREGTWRNGERVKRAVLKQGDRLHLGKNAVRFLFAPAEAVFLPPSVEVHADPHAEPRVHVIVGWVVMILLFVVMAYFIWRFVKEHHAGYVPIEEDHAWLVALRTLRADA